MLPLVVKCLLFVLLVFHDPECHFLCCVVLLSCFLSLVFALFGLFDLLYFDGILVTVVAE